MNLNNAPTKSQLSALLAGADDDAGHHILWIDTAGQVRLTLIDDSVLLTEFAAVYPTVRVRFEAFCVDNGCVGTEAADDEEHVSRYLDWLQQEWAMAADAGPGEIFAD
jgi:hypothetical protein